MVEALLAQRKPALLCTVYDSIPGLDDAARTALGACNDVILTTAFRAHLPVIDLRQVCTEDADYSCISPIEPSARGGAKIARLIAKVTTEHHYSMAQTVVHP